MGGPSVRPLGGTRPSIRDGNGFLAKVVKTLNTVTVFLMVNPGLVANADHTMFMCRNDTVAKNYVTQWLKAWCG